MRKGRACRQEARDVQKLAHLSATCDAQATAKSLQRAKGITPLNRVQWAGKLHAMRMLHIVMRSKVQ